MPKTLIAGLLAAILLVVFAIQNASEILVRLFFWDFYISLALIMIICIFLGAIAGSLFSYAKYAKKSRKSSKETVIQPHSMENIKSDTVH